MSRPHGRASPTLTVAPNLSLEHCSESVPAFGEGQRGATSESEAQVPTASAYRYQRMTSAAHAVRSPRQRLEMLDTPCVLVDRTRFEANLNRMAAHARSAGL